MAALKHPTDPKMGITSAQAIWHADSRMQALVEDIFARCKPARFVETGTHLGWTAHWVATRYPSVPLHTVENMRASYDLASENLAGLPNVNQAFGDSRTFLRALKDLQGVTFYWLDAHWHTDHPLRSECQIVSNRSEPYVCLIDDFHCGADFPGDQAAVAWVEQTLGRDYWKPNYAYQKGYSGYVLFVRGVDYTPPASMRRNM